MVHIDPKNPTLLVRIAKIGVMLPLASATSGVKAWATNRGPTALISKVDMSPAFVTGSCRFPILPFRSLPSKESFEGLRFRAILGVGFVLKLRDNEG